MVIGLLRHNMGELWWGGKDMAKSNKVVKF